jgi:hypothetical protein
MDDVCSNRKAYTLAGDVGIQAMAAFENAALLFGGDSRAVVGDANE